MNTATKSATQPEAPAAPSGARILKIAQCPSLSGKSQLTYHIGCNAEAQIHFRIVANTGSGFYSQEWVALSAIEQEFAKVPAGETITSFQLHAMFRGKSVNTPAFLFAALKNEALVEVAKDKQRQYNRVDPKAFVSMVQALIASGVSLKWESPSKADAKKTKGDAKVAGKVNAKTTKSAAKTAAIEVKAPIEVPSFIPPAGAKPTAGSKSAAGVDIAEIVEVINAKVDVKPAERVADIEPETKPAMPVAKTTKKATAKTASKAKQ